MQILNLIDEIDCTITPSDLHTYTIRLCNNGNEYSIPFEALLEMASEKTSAAKIYYNNDENTMFLPVMRIPEFEKNRNAIILTYYDMLVHHQQNIIELKTAHLNCVQGRISKIRISKIFTHHDQSDNIIPGLYSCFVDYIETIGDEDEIVNTLEVVPLQFFPEESMFFENIKTLVGGNHQYTNDIAIQLDGFSLQSIQEEYADVFAKSRAIFESKQKDAEHI